MTPVQIRIMLHYHVYATTDYEDSPEEQFTKQVAFLVHNEMLRQGDDKCKPRYLITAKGAAYVTMLRDVPVPVVKFADPRFEVMNVTAFAFGHRIFSVDGRNYFYADNHQACEGAEPRACPKCKLMPTEDGHDPCIANLPGIAFACCGHGVDDGYIKFPDGTVIVGEFSKMPAIAPDGNGGWDLVEEEK